MFTTAIFYNAPQTRFVAQFIGQSNLIEGRVADIAAVEKGDALQVGAPVELQVGERSITVLQD